MAVEVEVDLHEAEIEALTHEEWFRMGLSAIGDAIAAQARSTAPRSTGRRSRVGGHGADSIHAEMVMGPSGWEARVSWDEQHAYMALQRSHAIQDAANQYAGK